MSFEDATEWQRQWLEAQRRQLEAYEQWFGASRSVLDAHKKSLDVAEQTFRMQWRWLTFWGL
jgi:hypothetical protein